MSASRLYRAAGATGPQAATAVEALAESAQRPRLIPEAPDSADPDLLLRVLADHAPDGPADPADIPEPLPEIQAHQTALRATTESPATAPAIATEDRPVAAPPVPSPHAQVQPTASAPQPSDAASTEPSSLARMARLAQRTPASGLRWSRFLTVLVVVGLALGLITAVTVDGFGWFVGVPLTVLSVLLTPRLVWEDRWAGAVAPPLAWLAIIVGPGQILVTHDGSLALSQALLVAQGLTDNALWILLPAAFGALVARHRQRH